MIETAATEEATTVTDNGGRRAAGTATQSETEEAPEG
jgi:hypothetical protein